MYRRFLSEISDFIFAETHLEKADIIFVPGNRYPQNAEKAAKLYRLEGKQGAPLAPYILVSGKYSIKNDGLLEIREKRDLYPGPYNTEAEFLEDVLLKNGVPKEVIIKEQEATFTYQNAVFSKKITDKMGMDIKKAIICCRNTHARRCLMYFEEEYPDTEFMICPSVIDGITKENWTNSQEGIDLVMGEVKRLVQQFCLYMPEKNKKL